MSSTRSHFIAVSTVIKLINIEAIQILRGVELIQELLGGGRVGGATASLWPDVEVWQRRVDAVLQRSYLVQHVLQHQLLLAVGAALRE